MTCVRYFFCHHLYIYHINHISNYHHYPIIQQDRELTPQFRRFNNSSSLLKTMNFVLVTCTFLTFRAANRYFLKLFEVFWHTTKKRLEKKKLATSLEYLCMYFEKIVCTFLPYRLVMYRQNLIWNYCDENYIQTNLFLFNLY